jgi:protein-S-isoprenylcysteine O-methyltransferase Ste14
MANQYAFATNASSGRSFIKSALAWTFLFAAPLFAASGTLHWWKAWVFLIINFASLAFLHAAVYRAFPGLARERAAARSKTEKWDKILVPLVVAFLPLLSNILAGFDKRWGWTHSITPFESSIALATYIAATSIVDWSMRANPFFSSHFNIQNERGHTVVSRGPYAVVRHPGYSGMIFGSLALPIFFGSIAALAVGIVSACLTILRTWFEDQALKAQLPGYQEYSGTTRYRLIPLVW